MGKATFLTRFELARKQHRTHLKQRNHLKHLKPSTTKLFHASTKMAIKNSTTLTWNALSKRDSQTVTQCNHNDSIATQCVEYTTKINSLEKWR